MVRGKKEGSCSLETPCPLPYQRSSCFWKGGGCWGLLQDQSQAESVPDDEGAKGNFVKILSVPWAG